MKQAKFSFLRFSTLITLALLFLYCSSVQEIHYLFVNHHAEVNEHCHNHLHAQTGHIDCNLCKIELSTFVKAVDQVKVTVPACWSCRIATFVPDNEVSFKISSFSPRGPPISAC